MRGVEFCDERARPILEYIRKRSVVCDSEGQVEIRPTIALVVRKRTNDSASDHPLVYSDVYIPAGHKK